MQQKLVTIYLDNEVYRGKEWLTGSFRDAHGLAEEHLQEYLEEGWRIASVQGFGGAAHTLHVRGWFAVVLERE